MELPTECDPCIAKFGILQGLCCGEAKLRPTKAGTGEVGKGSGFCQKPNAAKPAK